MTDDEEFDTRLGARIQHLRESLGLTQARLADAMTARGHSWHQQTVVKTEKGSRPLRFAEALGLADILRTDVGELDGARHPDVLVDEVRRHLHECEDAARECEAAATRAADARARLSTSIARAGDAVPDTVAAAARAALRTDP